MPSSGENGEFDQSSDSEQSGDINGSSIPSTATAGSSQTKGSSQGRTVNADGEMANTTAGTDAQGGMPGQQSGAQAGSELPGGTSNTAGNSNSDGGLSTTAVVNSGLPGLEPFPTAGLPGDSSGTLGDILGNGGSNNGTQGDGSGNSGAGGRVIGAGSGSDPFETATNGSGAGNQGNEPFGTDEGTGTIAGSTRGEGEFSGEESSAGNGDNPFGVLASGRDQPMTQSERQAALDARLEESIAVFDGMILSEREAAQGIENENAGGGAAGGNGGQQNGSGSQGNGTGGDAPIVIASAPNRSSGGGVMPDLGRNREGDFDNSSMPQAPIPDDIPSGNDDDIVARQLREAAMNEPDPELRERLWNEYRNYTGLPIPEESISGV
jgi:hypothetical protein